MTKYAIHESDSSLVVCKTHVLSKWTCISELFRDILYWKQIIKRFSFRQKKTMLLRWQKVKNTELIKSIYHTVIIFKRWPLKRYSFGPTKSWLVFDSWRGTSTPTIGNLWNMNLVCKFEKQGFSPCLYHQAWFLGGSHLKVNLCTARLYLSRVSMATLRWRLSFHHFNFSDERNIYSIN